MTKVIGLLGGTFDPIHHGHLRLALECVAAAGIDSLRLVPAHQPPHRPAPVANPGQRLEMTRLAADNEPTLAVDDLELRRGGTSWTVDTLESVRRSLDGPLCIVLGADAFAGLPTWHRWQDVLALAHIIVADRPAAGAPGPALAELESRCGTTNPADLREKVHGHIMRITVPALAISSTRIREHVASGRSVRYLVPDPVIQFIQQEGLYRNTP